MGYFGGGGVQGALHPSFQAYIDCFSSPPFPKMWPRGGGIWDQDPELVRDFRAIREFELQWKSTNEQLANLKNRDMTQNPEQGGPDLEGLLNQKLEEMGLEDEGYF